MARRRKGRDIHGVVLLDKPVGFSSNQALQKVRWLFQARKAGHTGSLDPFATGMLPICLGEASKTAGFMLDASKSYVATAELGIATETGDIEGEVVEQAMVPELDSTEIQSVLETFIGRIDQVPPMYSALKVDGKPLYQLAREGKVVERKSRPVNIHSLELIDWRQPLLTFRVHCSKGTYVRTLGEDIARALNTVAHLKALRRQWVEPFDAANMLTMQALEDLSADGRLEEVLLPVDSGLSDWPQVTLSQEQATRFRHGNPVDEATDQAVKSALSVRVYDDQQKLLGLGRLVTTGSLVAVRVMNL